MDDYFDANRRNWNDRARVHAASRLYDMGRFDDPDVLSSVVDFDRRYLGDIAGLDVVHLQCHIGSDTISLARLGARVTGLDISEESIVEAQRLFARTGTTGRFVVANVYDAVEALDATYDVVYTGVGALNWLPDITRWGRVVAALLRPGGRLIVRDFHPMAYSLAETTDGTLRLEYPYFETTRPLSWDDGVTYSDVPDGMAITNTRQYEWGHGLAETHNALTSAGLVVTTFEEHRGLEWQMLPHMVLEGGLWYLPPEQRDLCPMMFVFVAEKRG